MIDVIKKALDAAFQRISQELTDEGVVVLMPTFSPSQGRLLSEFNRVGGKAYIAGGIKTAPAFANVPQFGLDFDTTAYINMFPAGMSEKIVGAIPDDLIRDRKVAVFAFITPPGSWAKHIADRNLGAEIVATNEQNTRLFYENKGNLMHVLGEAGLSAYVIPTEVVNVDPTEAELRAIYRRVKSESGKVVVQSCIENYEPTRFIGSEDEFVAKMTGAKTPYKVSRFIEGSEANLSFFVGNTLPAEEGRGVVKCNLPDGIDCGRPESLALIEAHAAEKGIDASNVFSVTGRATLKVVGDSLLANEPGDSVGNNIGHVYPDHIAAQIAEIGDKLGRKMALGGKVGLAGADLLIDATGKIWINEINDRQQGPTDQMSADAEAAGIPGLSRMAWFAHYADFSQEQNLSLLAAIRDNAAELHRECAQSDGSFYIKVYATHDAELDGHIKARKDLPAGVYSVYHDGKDWHWEKLGKDAALRPVDLESGAITVKISSGSLKKGDTPLAGAEMFRIIGIASGEDAPFIIEEGFSCINPQWRPIIEKLYEDCFGEGYTKLNPLYQKSVEEEPVKASVRIVNKTQQPGR